MRVGGGGDSYSSLGPLPSQVDYELMSIISKILRIQNSSLTQSLKLGRYSHVCCLWKNWNLFFFMQCITRLYIWNTRHNFIASYCNHRIFSKCQSFLFLIQLRSSVFNFLQMSSLSAMDTSDGSCRKIKIIMLSETSTNQFTWTCTL